MSVPIPKMTVGQIYQLCVVVRDVRAAMRQYWETVGIGPWKLYHMGPDNVNGMTYHGRPASFTFLMAHAWVGNLDIELVQPLEGPSIYQDFLDRRGEGLQHIGVLVDDLDAAIADAAAKGIAVLQMGRDAGVGRTDGKVDGFAYLDTEASVHVTFELLQRPGPTVGAPPEPLEVYPPASE